MAKKKKAAKVTGIDHLYVATKNFASAWAFWTNLAGGIPVTTWGEGAHKAGLASFGSTGIVVAQEREGQRAELGYDIVFGRPQLFLRAEGIDALYEALRARGAKLVSPLHKTHWGPRAFSIEGPDGLVVSFVEPD